MIAHSTGGLVIRRLLEERHLANDAAFLGLVRKVIGFGVPWAGTLQPVPFLVGRDGFALASKKVSQAIVARSWAAYDLLPPPHDPAAGADMSDEGGALDLSLRGSDQVGLAAERTWFGRSNAGLDVALQMAMEARAGGAIAQLGRRQRSWDVPVELVNVVGWGEPTIVRCGLRPVSGGEILEVEDESSRDGDGTVPRRSAAWLRSGVGRVDTFHLPVGLYQGVKQRKHSSLWRTPGGRELLARFLTGEAPMRQVYATVDEREAGAANDARVTVHLLACDAVGAPLAAVATRAFGANQSVDIPGLATTDLGRGRYAVQVPRAGMQRVPVGQPRFRRFTLEVRWAGAAAAERFPFLVN